MWLFFLMAQYIPFSTKNHYVLYKVFPNVLLITRVLYYVLRKGLSYLDKYIVIYLEFNIKNQIDDVIDIDVFFINRKCLWIVIFSFSLFGFTSFIFFSFLFLDCFNFCTGGVFLVEESLPNVLFTKRIIGFFFSVYWAVFDVSLSLKKGLIILFLPPAIGWYLLVRRCNILGCILKSDSYSHNAIYWLG